MLRLLLLLNLSETVRTAFFVSALPIAGPALHLSAALIGVLAGGHYLADALAKGPAGLLIRRWGLGPALLPGPLLGLAALAAARWHPSPLLALGCAAWGLGYAALWPAVMSASQALALPHRTARALSISNLSVAPAVLLGTLGAGPLMERHPELTWNALLTVQGAAALLTLSLLRVRLPHAPRPAQAARGRWSRVAALLPAAFVQTLAPGLLVTVFYPLLQRLHLRLVDLILPGALALVVLALSLWLIGGRADRQHPHRVLRPGLLLLAVTFALAALPNLDGHLWLIAPLLGLGYGAFLTGWNGLVARTLPPQERAAAWGTVMAVEALGYAVGPALGGAAWEAAGPGGVFALGAVAFLLALASSVQRRPVPPEADAPLTAGGSPAPTTGDAGRG